MRVYIHMDNNKYKQLDIKSKMISLTPVNSIIKHFDKIEFARGISSITSSDVLENFDDNIKHINVNYITSAISESFYTVNTISMENLPIIDNNKYWCFNSEKSRVFSGGWNTLRINFYTTHYKCNVCGIIISGPLCEHPILDHIVHNPHCPYTKLSTDIKHVYTISGHMILYDVFHVSDDIYDNAFLCRSCKKRRISIVYTDCLHADSCKTCFFAKKTCTSCDKETTEFCIISFSSIERPLYKKTETLNMSDMSVLYESQNYHINVPCMHVCNKNETGFCKICMTCILGTLIFKFTYKINQLLKGCI